uniref:NAD kinase n=3 Tax=candidate division WOR-3 bacterium TaxID=2052148 RepID=A0A7V4E548_UNCW3
MRLGITGNPYKTGIDKVIEHILKHFDDSELLIWNGLENNLKEFKNLNYADELTLKEEADIVVSIGGDGTFLRSARFFIEKPIMGINVGTFGFLTIYGEENLQIALENLKKGNWTCEERTVLQAKLNDKTLIALNDITFNVTGASRMMTVEVRVNKEKLYDFRGDGLIISTPTGSTAYNLSSGGPILYPTMDAFVITPICPHKLSLRPVVVPAESLIEVTVSSKTEEMIVSADGQETIPITNITVLLTKNNNKAKIVKTPGILSYFEILKRKLYWG